MAFTADSIQWQHDWIASGVFEEGANSSRHAFLCLVPSTLQQLLGAFSSPRQINGNSIPGSPGIDIGTAPYCHRLLLRLNPLTPNTTCPVAPMQAPPTNHITTTMQPRPSHGGFPGKLRTLPKIRRGTSTRAYKRTQTQARGLAFTMNCR